MKKKLTTLFFLILISAIVIGATAQWRIEKVDLLIKNEIKKISSEKLPIFIDVQSTSITLVPLTLELINTSITPKDGFENQLNATTVESIKVQPNLFHILWGKFTIRKLEIKNTLIDSSITLTSGPTPEIDINKILSLIPLQQIEVDGIDLNLKIKDGVNFYHIKTKSLAAKITNDLNSVMCKLSTQKVQIKNNSGIIADEASLETQFFLTNKNLVLSDLKYIEKNSFILSSGSTQHNLKKKTITSSNINLRLQTNARKIENIISILFPKEDIAELKKINGQIRIDLLLTSVGINKFKTESDISLINFSYENFHIGEIQAESIFNSQDNTIKLKKARMTSPGIKATITGLNTNLTDLNFQDINVDIEHFELHDYLKYAIQEDIPAYGKVSGQFKCIGSLKNFSIKCPGKIQGQSFQVNTNQNKHIVALKKIEAEGVVNVDDSQVSYHAQIKTPLSKGQSHGSIKYKTGFEIYYETPQLNLQEIGKLSVLDIDGLASIKGKTVGNSKTAVFEMQIDSKNTILDKYKLGDFSAKINYKTALLFFNKIQGSLASSRYLGALTIDLDKDWLNGKLQIPFVDLSIAQDSIKNQLDIPVPISGSGSAILNLDSPLESKKLSFKLKSRIYNAVIDRQHVDTIDIDLISNLGKIEFKQLIAEEKKSKVYFTGSLNLEQRLYEIDFHSDKIYLDDVSYVEKLSSSTKGVFLTEGKIRGAFEKPDLDLKFSSDLFQISGQKLSPLKGTFIANKQKLAVDIKGPDNFSIKYLDDLKQDDVQIEGRVQNINTAPFLTNLLQLESLDDYQIYTTSTFNLKVNKSNSQIVNGYIYIPDIKFVFQKNEMKNEKEITLFLSNGHINFNAFNLSGESSSLTLKNGNNGTPIDLQITGLISLSYLQIFAPFLETLEGKTSINLKIQGHPQKIQFLGSAFIDDGFIKLPQIPHAIENLDVDILFNQDQLIINSLKGKFATGSIFGDGRVLIKGQKNIPTFLNLHFESISLEIPPQFNTKGNADLQLTGNWLPLTLSGSYEVHEGLITKELTSNDSVNANPHEAFLPTELKENLSSPLKLDITVTPLAPIKIKNTLLDGKAEGQMKIVGDPQSPTLSGNMTLTKNSQIKLQDVVFKTVDSSFIFKGQTPPNPEIYLLADTRYKNYDIEMLVQGTASKPKFKLTSQPSLTEPEIISLLTLGTTSQEQDAKNQASNNTTSGQNRTSSVEFRSDLFSKIPLSKEFKERFGVDVKFSPTFDSENNVAAPKISVGYQVSDKVTATGSVQGGTERKAEGSVRYDLNRNVGAKVSVQTQNYEESDRLRGNIQAPPEILGIGLDYRQEFK